MASSVEKLKSSNQERMLLLIALAIQPVKVGEVLKKLPGHCTIIHWFPSCNIEWIKNAIKRIFPRYAPIPLLSKQFAMFGENNDIPCYTLEKNQKIMRLHEELLKEISLKNPELLKNPWVGENYCPHVSIVNEFHFVQGSRFYATEIYIAERFINPLSREKNNRIRWLMRHP